MGKPVVEPVWYEVTTTAQVKGKTVMCVSVPWNALEGSFDRVRLLQPRQNSSAEARSAKVEKLVDQTIMKGGFAPDAAAKRLCAQLSSLEPIAVAMRDRH